MPPNPATRFTKAVARAAALPHPGRIATLIAASSTGADNGLRAASYEARVSGTRGDSHPERVAARRNRWPEPVEDGQEPQRDPARREPDTLARRHIDQVHRASESFCDVVATLLAEFDHGYELTYEGPADDVGFYAWEHAVTDATAILCTPLHIPTCDKVGCSCDTRADIAANRRHTANLMGDATRHVATLAKVLQRWTARNPTLWEQYRQDGGTVEEICDVHASLRPPTFKPKDANFAGQLCTTCGRLRNAAGTPPPAELIELLERGTQTAYRNARNRWLEQAGVPLDT